MKIRRLAALWVLVLLVSLFYMGTAVHAEQAGAVYHLKWLKTFYDTTATYSVPHTLSPDSLVVEGTSSLPLRNYVVTNRLEVLFSFSGSIESTVPANTVEIRVPASIFTNAQGKPAESSVVVPLPDDTSFDYRLDPETNEFVIYNF